MTQRPNSTTELRATPVHTAASCALNWRSPGDPGNYLTWDKILDLAVEAYWDRRLNPARKTAA